MKSLGVEGPTVSRAAIYTNDIQQVTKITVNPSENFSSKS